MGAALPGLVPGIHVFLSCFYALLKAWMAGTSPATTGYSVAVIRLSDM
jgi:hypothetical protein